MTHGSLFSGIGGFDLAAEWMGWENVFHCERNEFGQKILKKNFPNAISYGDITKTDFTKHKGEIDIISGGFPCQPFSTAGKRKGKDDDRHLWPEMLRAIGEIQPCWVIGENVSGLLNWGKGLVLDEIKSDLEAKGFEVFSPLVLPALSVNAPHRRDRVWFVAYSKQRVCKSSRIPDKIPIRIMENKWSSDEGSSFVSSQWLEYKTDRRTLRNDDGFSEGLDRIGALGNAIVPQVAYQIFKSIQQYEDHLK